MGMEKELVKNLEFSKVVTYFNFTIEYNLPYP